MDHKTYVGFVDPHTEGHRRDNDLDIITLKGFLNVSTLVGVHASVITRSTKTVIAQLLSHHLHFLTTTTIDDAAIAFLCF